MGIMAYPLRKLLEQCSLPHGLAGRLLAKGMNKGHGPLTRWGLEHLQIAPDAEIIDIGCGGGGTLRRLAGLAPDGRVVGIDLSPVSVQTARKTNRDLIEKGTVEILLASVESLPFADNTFDLAAAIETHLFWPDIPANFAEVLRLLRPGGQFMVLAGIYKGSPHAKRERVLVNAGGMAYLGEDDFKQLFATAGFDDIKVDCDPRRGSICAIGRRPLA